MRSRNQAWSESEFQTNLSQVYVYFDERISDWGRMKKIIGIVLKYKQISKHKLSPALNTPTVWSNGIIDIKLLEKGSVETTKML